MGWPSDRENKWETERAGGGRQGCERELLRNERGTHTHTHTQAVLSHIYTRTAGLCGICEQLRKKLNKIKTMTSLFFPPNKLFFAGFSLFFFVSVSTQSKSSLLRVECWHFPEYWSRRHTASGTLTQITSIFIGCVHLFPLNSTKSFGAFPGRTFPRSWHIQSSFRSC